MRSVCDRIAAFPGPVLAALNGHALGGGAEVAVAADIRLAADDIKIGFNQVALAIMPAWGGAERLAALVGKSRALLLAGTGIHPDGGRGRIASAWSTWSCRATSFEDEWRSRGEEARHTARRRDQAGDRRGIAPEEAVAAFARLWVVRRALGRRRPGDEPRAMS